MSMLRALYSFKKTHPTSLSFSAGDLFVELPTGRSAEDKNWHYVLALEVCEAGYVPRNYVTGAERSLARLEAAKESLRMRKIPDKERAELLAGLEAAKTKMLESGAPSSRPHSATKKRAAPKPPPAIEEKSTSNNDSTSSPRRGSSGDRASGGRRPSLLHASDPTPDQVRSHARDLVEMVRVETGLSHANSQSVVQTVLSYVCTNLPRLDRNLPHVLMELDRPAMSVDVEGSADSKAMEGLLERLTSCKEDDQQRNWMLYEDETAIKDLLTGLAVSMQNSDRRVSVFVLGKYKYFYVHSLVEYYQMETRWSIRRLLIENFMLMCSLDPVIVSLLLSSVLPLELAQDLFQNTEKVTRLRMCALLLTVIFSRGEPMPVQYFDQLGATFVNFLLDYIEAPPTQDSEHEIPDAFIGLALSYNLQFRELNTNVTVSCLAGRSGAKVWTEKVLLLLNRETDPSAIVGDLQPGIARTNSVHKIILDMFNHESCHQLFYTNDILVLIDIIVRQLSDLSPGEPSRTVYLTMCRLVLSNTDYSSHLHRMKDLERCFVRILDEEDDGENERAVGEKREVERICKDVEAFKNLV